MGHASKPTVFSQRLATAIDTIADSFVRRTVVDMPMRVRQWMNNNRHKMSICCHDMPPDSQELVLAMLNDDWSVSLRDKGGVLEHYCPAGCCASDKDCSQKMKAALKATVGNFFDIPLLYRWKHFDPAVAFTLRNLVIHGLLRVVWEATMNKALDDDMIDLSTIIDADAADMAPAMKQKVRMGKVWQLLGEDGILVAWCFQLNLPGFRYEIKSYHILISHHVIFLFY